MALTVMDWRVQLAIISWLRCVGWQLVHWQCIIWLVVLPHSPTPSSVPTVSGLLACQPCESSEPAFCRIVWQRQKALSPLTVLLSSPPSAYFEGLFVWSSNLLRQSCDAVLARRFKNGLNPVLQSLPSTSRGVISAPLKPIFSILLHSNYIIHAITWHSWKHLSAFVYKIPHTKLKYVQKV